MSFNNIFNVHLVPIIILYTYKLSMTIILKVMSVQISILEPKNYPRSSKN